MRITTFIRLSPCAALVLAAACNSDTTAPATLSDPQATIAAVAALDSAFHSNALASFAGLKRRAAPWMFCGESRNNR